MTTTNRTENIDFFNEYMITAGHPVVKVEDEAFSAAGYYLRWEKGSHYIELWSTLNDAPVDIAANLYDYTKGEAHVPSFEEFEEAADYIAQAYGF